MRRPLSSQIKILLSTRQITVLIVLVAIIGRVIQLIFFYNIRVDAAFQVMATANFVDGYGISIGNVAAESLEQTKYEPLINWPPGYSLILAPFYLLFNRNYIAAGLALDIIAAVSLIFILRAILKELQVSLWLVNLFTLINGFFIYYFYFIASSDSIAIVFFSLAIYLSLRSGSVRTVNRISFVLMTICLFIAGLIKYLFIPVLFVVPALLFYKGYSDKNPQLKRAAFISFLTLAMAFGTLLLYQKSISGQAAYISSTGRGFFPEHLLDAYPFSVASFSKPDTIPLLLHLDSSVSDLLYKVLQVIHLFVLIAFTVAVLKSIRLRNPVPFSTQRFYFYHVYFISITITFLLAVLSLFVSKEEIWPGVLWTYVEEARYYGLANILVQTSFFVFLSRKDNISGKAKAVLYLLLFFLLLETGRGMLFDIKRVALSGKEEYSWQFEKRFQDFAHSIIQKHRDSSGIKRIVVTGSHYYWNHRICLTSKVPIMEKVSTINQPELIQSKVPALLLIVLKEDELERFQPFIQNKGYRFEGSYSGFSFYTIYVNPHGAM